MGSGLKDLAHWLGVWLSVERSMLGGWAEYLKREMLGCFNG